MPRTSQNTALNTRAARLRLAPRDAPYWHTIQEGRAIGYRRLSGDRDGAWIVRSFNLDTKERKQERLGAADDFTTADGAGTLTWAQAVDRAQAWFAALARAGGRVIEPLTVGQALDNYIADYTARGGRALKDMQWAINAHIRPALGHRLVNDLTTPIIRAWLRALAVAAPRLRRKVTDKAPRVRAIASDDLDARRGRQATANRVLTVLKAALNFAYREGQAASDDAWRRVAPYKNVDAARVRYITDAEATRLIAACPADLRRLVTAALYTGCRYGELARLRPGDVNAEAGSLAIRASKSGKARHVVLTAEAGAFFTGLCEGKSPRDLILTHDDGSAWAKSHQFRPLREACAEAEITPAISFHILRHTHASRLALAGVPLGVIAAQLGNSEAICAKHYAHLSPGYIAQSVRAAFGDVRATPPTAGEPAVT